jgi:hypothetical protein
MPTDLTPEAWAQIRSDYEHTDRPVDDICFEHGISAGTLRDRVRRWGWTPRRQPIPLEGPPPAPPLDVASFTAAAPIADAPIDHTEMQPPPHPSPFQGEGAHPSWRTACDSPVVPAAGGDAPGDIVPRLQSAVARVLPAIEATVARLAAGGTHPRELERAGRTLAALTRTLRELNGLLEQRRAADSVGDPPRDIAELRASLARKLQALIDEKTGETARAVTPDGASTGAPQPGGSAAVIALSPLEGEGTSTAAATTPPAGP